MTITKRTHSSFSKPKKYTKFVAEQGFIDRRGPVSSVKFKIYTSSLEKQPYRTVKTAFNYLNYVACQAQTSMDIVIITASKEEVRTGSVKINYSAKIRLRQENNLVRFRKTQWFV